MNRLQSTIFLVTLSDQTEAPLKPKTFVMPNARMIDLFVRRECDHLKTKQKILFSKRVLCTRTKRVIDLTNQFFLNTHIDDVNELTYVDLSSFELFVVCERIA